MQMLLDWMVSYCQWLYLQVGLGQLFYQGGRGVDINHEVRSSSNIVAVFVREN